MNEYTAMIAGVAIICMTIIAGIAVQLIGVDAKDVAIAAVSGIGGMAVGGGVTAMTRGKDD